MTINSVILERMKSEINDLDNEDIDLVLALLHKRKCNKTLNPECKDCSWRGSSLCLPIRRYLEAWYKENEDELV